MAVTRKRKLAALLVAACADLAQAFLFPLVAAGGLSPVEWAVDIVVATALLMVVGFKVRLALAFFIELVPGLALFPTWTALVLTLSVVESVSASGPVDRNKVRVIDIPAVADDKP